MGNKIDNRIENLRLVMIRRKPAKPKKHREGKLVGCYFDKSNGKYHTNKIV